MNSIETLEKLDACAEAVDWAKQHGGNPEELWRDCARGDWLLWAAVRAGGSQRLVARATCAIVRPALAHMPADESRPRKAIESIEALLRGEVTIEDVKAAADAAHAASRYTDGAAYHAASAAYYAADAVIDIACGADASDATAYVASHAAVAAVVTDALAEPANIVRAHIPWSTITKLLEKVK